MCNLLTTVNRSRLVQVSSVPQITRHFIYSHLTRFQRAYHQDMAVILQVLRHFNHDHSSHDQDQGIQFTHAGSGSISSFDFRHFHFKVGNRDDTQDRTIGAFKGDLPIDRDRIYRTVPPTQGAATF